MTGLRAELEYPSQKAKVKPQPRTQQADSGDNSQIGQTGLIEYRKKKGNQQAIKLPMIKPRISVARLSFLRAIRFFSFSASCSGVNLATGGTFCWVPPLLGLLFLRLIMEGPSVAMLGAVGLLSIFLRMPLRGEERFRLPIKKTYLAFFIDRINGYIYLCQ